MLDSASPWPLCCMASLVWAAVVAVETFLLRAALSSVARWQIGACLSPTDSSQRHYHSPRHAWTQRGLLSSSLATLLSASFSLGCTSFPSLLASLLSSAFLSLRAILFLLPLHTPITHGSVPTHTDPAGVRMHKDSSVIGSRQRQILN